MLLLHIHRVIAEGAIPESLGADPPYNDDALETMTIALTEVDLDDDGED